VLKEQTRPKRGFFACSTVASALPRTNTVGRGLDIRRGAVGLVCSRSWSRRRLPVAHHAGKPGPDEDQGFYIAAVILPDGATLERTDKVVDE
jgi:hypothetical protein